MTESHDHKHAGTDTAERLHHGLKFNTQALQPGLQNGQFQRHVFPGSGQKTPEEQEEKEGESGWGGAGDGRLDKSRVCRRWPRPGITGWRRGQRWVGRSSWWPGSSCDGSRRSWRTACRRRPYTGSRNSVSSENTFRMFADEKTQKTCYRMKQ